MSVTEEKTLPPELQAFRNKLKCSFEQIDDVFEECITDAQRRLTNKGEALRII